MRANTDLSKLMRRGRETRPTKRTMNLYFRVDRTTKPATAFLYILFTLVVLLALAKVLIYDPWMQVRQLEAQADSAQARLLEAQQELEDYDQILEQYLRASLTQRELALVDRMDLLELIDTAIRPEAEITRVSITGDEVLLSFSQVTLGQAAQLVSRLEQSPLVSQVTVDTASTDGEDQSTVSVSIYFKVLSQSEEEEVEQP